jgi:L,D-transpeptidase catalytic domain
MRILNDWPGASVRALQWTRREPAAAMTRQPPSVLVADTIQQQTGGSLLATGPAPLAPQRRRRVGERQQGRPREDSLAHRGAWAIPWHPTDFLGSCLLELTAHSEVLQQFDGGDGTVGIHGRGGASLLDPLGTAASHGCISLANDSIDWLVATVGEARLPGTPVQIS